MINLTKDQETKFKALMDKVIASYSDQTISKEDLLTAILTTLKTLGLSDAQYVAQSNIFSLLLGQLEMLRASNESALQLLEVLRPWLIPWTQNSEVSTLLATILQTIDPVITAEGDFIELRDFYSDILTKWSSKQETSIAKRQPLFPYEMPQTLETKPLSKPEKPKKSVSQNGLSGRDTPADIESTPVSALLYTESFESRVLKAVSVSFTSPRAVWPVTVSPLWQHYQSHQPPNLVRLNLPRNQFPSRSPKLVQIQIPGLGFGTADGSSCKIEPPTMRDNDPRLKANISTLLEKAGNDQYKLPICNS